MGIHFLQAYGLSITGPAVVLTGWWVFKASENAPVTIPIFLIPSLSAASPIALLPWLKLCNMCIADDYLATGPFYVKKPLIVPHNADGAEGYRWMGQPNHLYYTRHSDSRFTARFTKKETYKDVLATAIKTMVQEYPCSRLMGCYYSGLVRQTTCRCWES